MYLHEKGKIVCMFHATCYGYIMAMYGNILLKASRPRAFVFICILKPTKEAGIFMFKILIAWIFSAVILWLLSFVPFMEIAFGGTRTWLAILVVAVIVGLINALIVPAVKRLFKKAHPAVLFCVSLVIDAAALWLAHIILRSWFTIEFFPTAIIAAAVLALVNVGFGFSDKKK